MKRIVLATLLATAATLSGAAVASADTVLLRGTDGNDKPTVQLFDTNTAPAAGSIATHDGALDGDYVSIASSGGSQLLIVPNEKNDSSKRVFIR
ncbi:MAG: hypothetical protein C0606_13130 [Hyphomicrobiales bacterium]|nr:MAG: hypothetical protein C0606_13130 [Hyphomicrobiales bacterium]